MEEDKSNDYDIHDMISLDEEEQRALSDALEWILKDPDEAPTLDDILKLKAYLSTCSPNWSEAMYHQGFDFLLLRATIRSEDIDARIRQAQLLECVKYAMDFSFLPPKEEDIWQLTSILAQGGFEEEEDPAGPIEPLQSLVIQILCGLVHKGEDTGYDTVIGAMDYLKYSNGESVRFATLVSKIGDESAPIALKSEILVFLNTLLSSSQTEVRLELRQEMIHAGLLEGLDKLRKTGSSHSRSLLSDEEQEVQNQIAVFDAVLNTDMQFCWQTTGSGNGLNLSDPEVLFKEIYSRSLESDCYPYFMSVLQHMLLIPSYDVLGKWQWEEIEKVIHTITVKDDPGVMLNISELKELLTLRERVEVLSKELAQKEKDFEEYKILQQHNNGPSTEANDANCLLPHKPKLPFLAGLSKAEPTIQPVNTEGPSNDSSSMQNKEVGGEIRAPPPFLSQLQKTGEEKRAPPPFLAGIKEAGGEKQAPPPFLSYIQNAGEERRAPPPFLAAIAEAGGEKRAPPPFLAGIKDAGGEKRPPPPFLAGIKDAGGEKRAPPPFLAGIKESGGEAKRPALPFLGGIASGKDDNSSSEEKTKSTNVNAAALGNNLAALMAKRSDGESPHIAQAGVAQLQGEIPLSCKARKPVIVPNVPLKALFWTKIPDSQIDSTVWEELDDSKISLDVKELEENFSKQTVKKKQEPTDTQKVTVSLVDPKEQQTVGIVLTKLRMTELEIKYALLSMDVAKLNLETLLSLRKIAPTNEKVEPIQSYQGDQSSFGKVEKFFLMTADIPNFAPRLDCFIYSLKFQHVSNDFRNSLKTLNHSCNEIRESPSLKRLLEIIMCLGNYLNGGTSRSGAYGFQINALETLHTIKSSDGNQTLMNYIARWCQNNQPNLLSLRNELPTVEKAARMSMSQWKADFKMYKDDYAKVEVQIKLAEKSAIEEDHFAEFLKPFVNEAFNTIKDLEGESKLIEDRCAKLMQEFGEDPKQMKCEEFFSIFLVFLVELERAETQNITAKELRERAEKRKLASEERKKKMELAKQGATKLTSVVDDVMDEIKSKSPADIVLGLSKAHRRQSSRHRLTGRPSLSSEFGGRQSLVNPRQSLLSTAKAPVSIKLRQRGSSIGFKTSNMEISRQQGHLNTLKEVQPQLASFLENLG